jgi:phospholipase C
LKYIERLVLLALGLGPAAGTALAAPVFRHVIMVIQENRTPDNLFGSKPDFEPGVDIATSGVNSLGQTIPLQPTPLVGCYDLGHKHSDFEAMLTEGADQVSVTSEAGCAVPANPQFKYIDNSTGIVQPYFDMAKSYAFANRMFETDQGASFVSHQFLFAGTSQASTDSPLFASDGIKNDLNNFGCMSQPSEVFKQIDGYGNEKSNPRIFPCFEHPTLTDVLDAAKLSWRYYGPQSTGIWFAPNAIQHICVPMPSGQRATCTGPDWSNGDIVANNPAQVLTDIQGCNLAAVSWVIPTGEESDHAETNTGLGPDWVASIINAVGQQPGCAGGETYWNDTAILVTWDDWGGWYDHVSPFAINLQPTSPPQWGDGFTYGFRVPLLVISAYTPNHLVDNTVHDFGSMLYFIEHNFNLGFIGPGDTMYSNYADYQAAARFDTMSEFFPRKTAKTFVPISTTTSAETFIRAPRSSIPPDSD